MATQANIKAYYDALRAGKDPDTYADILSSTMYDQGFVSSGADFAEAGAYGSYSPDVFTATVDTSNVGDFTFNKSLSDFDGYDFEFGDISNDDLKNFQEELMPTLAPLVAEAQLRGQSYENALMEAYEISPEVQGIYSKYGVSPKRISTNNQSEYVYDPFTFGEIQTVDRSMGLNDYVGQAVKGTLYTVAGAGLFGPAAAAIASAAPAVAQPILTASLTSAATAAATGGDPLTAAITAGVTAGIDPTILAADLGKVGTAAARGATSAALAEATGGDAAAAGLLTAGMSFIGDTLAEKRDSVNETIEEAVAEFSEETGVELPEVETGDLVNDVVASVGDDTIYLEDTISDIIADVGDLENLTTLQYKDQLFAKGGQRAVDLVFGGEGAIVQGLPARRNAYFPTNTSVTYGGIGSAVPDFIRKTVADPDALARGATVSFNLENLPPEVLARMSPEQLRALSGGGGGGGGAPVTDVVMPNQTSAFSPTSAPATSSFAINPNINPAFNFASAGSVTNYLLNPSSVLPFSGLMTVNMQTSDTSPPVTTTGGNIGTTGESQTGPTGATGADTVTGGTASDTTGGQPSGTGGGETSSGESDTASDIAGSEAAGGSEGGTGGGAGSAQGSAASFGSGTGTGSGSGTGSGDGSGDGSGSGTGLGFGGDGLGLGSDFSNFLAPDYNPFLLPYVTGLPRFEELDIFRRTI